MISGVLARFSLQWALTYTGVVLLVAMLLNLSTSFVQFGYSVTLPAIEETLHISHTRAGVLVTMVGAARMFSALLAGTLAPRYGHRIIIGLSALAMGGSMALLGFSGNYLLAVLAAGLMGFSNGGAITPMMGLLAAWFGVRDRGLAAGLAATGGSFGFILVGIAAPLFIAGSPDTGWRITWQLFGALTLVFGVAALIFVRERPATPPGATMAMAPAATTPPAAANPSSPGGVPPRVGAPLRSWPMEVYRNPAVWLVSFMAFCTGWGQGIFGAFFGLYLAQEQGISLGVVGQLVILIGVLSVVSGIMWGRLSDRIGRGAAFVISFLMQGVAFVMFAFFPGLAMFVAASALVGVTQRAGYTICAASSGDYVPPQYAATAFGIIAVMASLGGSISPTLGGVVADYIDMQWSFVLGLAGLLAGAGGGAALHWWRPARAGF